ncbi:MAG: helix-turn-helix domain-containing protein [Ferrimicrobium sp.]
MEPITRSTLIIPEAPALFTYPEACDYLRISKSTLWRLVEAKQITCARIGRSVRFTRVELDRFVAGLGD